MVRGRLAGGLLGACIALGARDAGACASAFDFARPGPLGGQLAAYPFQPDPELEVALPYLDVEQSMLVWDADAGVEDLVHESRFQRAGGTFGYVVPVPAMPDVSEVERSPFASLRGAFQFHPPTPMLGNAFGAGGLSGMQGAGQGDLGGGGGQTSDQEPPAPVEALVQQRIGKFTATTLSARDPSALEGWLRDNRLATTQSMRPWLEHYVRLGFYFVAFRYDAPAADAAASSGMTSETVHIRFKTPAPYFPYLEPVREKEPTGARLLAMWFVSRTALDPVASLEGDATAPHWARPWLAGERYAPTSAFLRKVVPTLEDLVPQTADAGTPLTVQTFRDYKTSRRGWGDVVMVPSKPVELTPEEIEARRPVFAVLDPALEPPAVAVSDAGVEAGVDDAATDATAPTPTDAAQPPAPVGSGGRGCNVGGAAAGGAWSALAIAALLLAARRRPGEIKRRIEQGITLLLALGVAGGCRATPTVSQDASPPSPSLSPSSASSASSAPSASATEQVTAPAPSADPERIRHEQALAELLSGKRTSTLPVKAGFEPQVDEGIGTIGTIGTLNLIGRPQITTPRRPVPPRVRMGNASVNGRLPPEVIQRILRQNIGRARACYERGLGSNPTLRGRVTVKFVIDRSGNVAFAADGGSDLPDSGVVQCLVSATRSLQFPQPEGGIVTVVQPYLLDNGA